MKPVKKIVVPVFLAILSSFSLVSKGSAVQYPDYYVGYKSGYYTYCHRSHVSGRVYSINWNNCNQRYTTSVTKDGQKCLKTRVRGGKVRNNRFYTFSSQWASVIDCR